ncbi:hypothetical protein [Pseudalkalibacillus decolorationis]|uniref:hypothetical protein n=1 Tax=Pseudalkalibacillus decolorationis TaxID=163879 RepID=UPI0021492007|nr:hypothetical protein [Pseudalkalibacillus decolorationis]
MTDFILEYKWAFFIAGEIIFWVSIIGFLVVRYVFGLERLGKYLIFIWLASDLWLLFIGILDYTQTGNFDNFQIIITAFLLYALTFGKNDFKKIDRFIKRKVKQWKGEPLTKEDLPERLYGMKHALKQLKEFGLHLLLYTIVITILAFTIEMKDVSYLLESSGGLEGTIENLVEHGLFEDPVAARVTGIWTLVLLIDGIITLSYVVFPRREKT